MHALSMFDTYNFVSSSVAEAYDKMQTELVTAKESLAKILTSKDVKATVR